jgi:menaquinone-dependent protoporphyrinogen IX oxidase
MKVLIAFYSRTGVTRKACERLAADLGRLGAEATTEEVIDTKDRSGITGWLGSGKDATFKRGTVIQPIAADVSAFDLVVIATPVWAFTMAPAIRTFCADHAPKCREVAFLATMGGSGDAKTFAAMRELCSREPVATLTLLDKKVKSDDAETFLLPVVALAERLTSPHE